MKQYVALFEKFEEEFDDFYQKPDTKSDTFYQQIAKELIELANQYTNSPIEIEMFDGKYGTASRIKDFQNDLIVMVNDQMGEDLAQEFATESDDLLAGYDITEKMKSSKVFAKDSEIEDNGVIGSKNDSENLEDPGTMDKMSSLRR